MEKSVPIKTAMWILPFSENSKREYLILSLGAEEFKKWKNGADIDSLKFAGLDIKSKKVEFESLLIELSDGVPVSISAH